MIKNKSKIENVFPKLKNPLDEYKTITDNNL